MHKIIENICLLGSSHIAKQSIEEIKKQYEEFQPEIIAIELDKDRLRSLFSKEKPRVSLYNIRVVGITGFIFGLVASYISGKLAKKVGMVPGIDMKTAAIIAKKDRKKLALIDQHIYHTLKKISKNVTFRDKLKIMADIFKGLFSRKRMIRELEMEDLNVEDVNFDLNSIPAEDIVVKLITYLKKCYPSIYKVMIHERNVIMSRKLIAMSNHFKDERILAVVGAGHVEGMTKILKDELEQKY